MRSCFSRARFSPIIRSRSNIASSFTPAIRRREKWPRFMRVMRTTKWKANKFGDPMKWFCVAMLLVFSSVRLSGAADAKDDLPSIFNGKDLSGWKVPADNKWWKVVDGVLIGENDQSMKGSMLYTEKSYGDVVVEAEVRWSGEIDSGIMLRKPEIQCQIGTSRGLKKDMSWSVYA